jgi:hypothetical protein
VSFWSALLNVVNSLGLVATQLGAFNIAHQVIIADTSRRSPSYEYRLAKYNERGYAVVLPSLKLDYEGQTRHFRSDFFDYKKLPCRMALFRWPGKEAGAKFQIKGTSTITSDYGMDALERYLGIDRQTDTQADR